MRTNALGRSSNGNLCGETTGGGQLNKYRFENRTLDPIFKFHLPFTQILRLSGRINISFLLAFCACSVLFASAQDLESLAEKITRGNEEQKRDALFTIRNLETEEASRIALPALKDNSEIVRATAAFSVIFLPEAAAARVLLPNLDDKSPLVRRETAYALGEVGSASATGPLLRILKEDKIIEVRDAAAIALGKIGDVSAVDDLLKILQRKPGEREEFLRRSAARSIGQIAQNLQNKAIAEKTPQNLAPGVIASRMKNEDLSRKIPVFRFAVPVLISSINNPKEFADVKREIAFALGAIGDPSAVPVLRMNLDADDYYFVQIIREALVKLNF